VRGFAARAVLLTASFPAVIGLATVARHQFQNKQKGVRAKIDATPTISCDNIMTHFTHRTLFRHKQEQQNPATNYSCDFQTRVCIATIVKEVEHSLN